MTDTIPPQPPPSTTAPKTKSKKSSLLSKLTSLPSLRSPSLPQSISDFYIRLADPHRTYTPGDLVRGSVILTAERDVRVTHLVVNLVGRVDLYGLASVTVGKKKTVNYAGPTEYEGGVVLCRDEQVLCGDGRLEAGVYEFGFCVEVGRGGWGISSLDFEKGSISYTISATITRPTKISPTRTCERRIALVEMIDVALLPVPKPRIIPLEPTKSRRSGAKSTTSSSDERGAIKTPKLPPTDITAAAASTNPTNTSNPATSTAANNTATTTSAGTTTIPTAPSAITPNTSNIQVDAASILTTNTTAVASKSPVCATVELLKGGCLRGESLPLKITVQHNKPVKSLHGVIITLVRQGRFDTVPLSTPPALGGKGKEKDLSAAGFKKSLSLSGSGGSTTTFRKDLAQLVVPLIVDPQTLSSTICTSIKVPEDAFPTISNVPKGLVSFRYFVEVLVDLGGKLAGRGEFMAGVVLEEDAGGAGRVLMGKGGGGKGVETERIRREVKRVVSCRFEVVVGTVDSWAGTGRSRRPMRNEEVYLAEEEMQQQQHQHQLHQHQQQQQQQHYHNTMERHIVMPPLGAPDRPLAHDYNAVSIPLATTDESDRYLPCDPSPPTPPPPPPPPPTDEKTRLRLAEQALMPSVPPCDAAAVPAPSAPPLDHIDPHYPSAPPPPIDPSSPSSSAAAAASSSSAPVPPSLHPQMMHQSCVDDKAELELRRLRAQASAPPPPPLAPSQPPPLAPELEHDAPPPSAPSLDALGVGDDEFRNWGALPRYER